MINDFEIKKKEKVNTEIVKNIQISMLSKNTNYNGNINIDSENQYYEAENEVTGAPWGAVKGMKVVKWEP